MSNIAVAHNHVTTAMMFVYGDSKYPVPDIHIRCALCFSTQRCSVTPYLCVPLTDPRLVASVTKNGRLRTDIDWTTHGVGAITAVITRIPINLFVHKTLAFVASLEITGISGTFPAVAAFVDGDHALVRPSFLCYYI